MSATDTMRWMGRSARSKASSVGHSMKDRVLEKRLERASDETDRLRLENEMLREEVVETRSEHQHILDLLESRLAESDAKSGRRSHRGRWLLFLTALGGGAWAVIRMRSTDRGHDEWGEQVSHGPAVTQSGTTV
jgi:hypothetical protein